MDLTLGGASNLNSKKEKAKEAYPTTQGVVTENIP